MAPRWWHIVPWPRENFNFPRSEMLLCHSLSVRPRRNKDCFSKRVAQSPSLKQWKRTLWADTKGKRGWKGSREIKTYFFFRIFSILFIEVSLFQSSSFRHFRLMLNKKVIREEKYIALGYYAGTNNPSNRI